jgi:putative transposase
MSASHQWKALAYVERNPVRAGMVGRPEEYRWSSAASHLSGKDRRGLLDWSVWRERGGSEAWSELLAGEEQLRELRLLRRCTFAGRPFGEEPFVEEIKRKFERRWRRWGFEKQAEATAGG